MDNTSIDRISFQTFDKLRSEYSKLIPRSLATLDTQRLHNIPESVKSRQQDGKAFLTKEELVTLMNWKLSHGKFRPSLKALIQQNAEADVQQVTGAGFAATQLKDAITILTKLRGVGPATASLLLSTWNSQEVPFFSDELFRWCLWENKPGSRWDRKIKYSVKEYEELVTRTKKLRDRIEDDYDENVTAIDIEMVAYVLGKNSVLIESSGEPEQPDTAVEGRKRKLASSSVDVSELKVKHKRRDSEGTSTPNNDGRSAGHCLRRSDRNKSKD